MLKNQATSATAHPNQSAILIRRPEVQRLTALSRSSIYELMRKDKFPKPVVLGTKSVAWVEVEVQHWIAERMAERGGAL